jgi:hypothetical protein
MIRPLRLVFRLSLVVAVVAALQFTTGTPSGAGSPYVSSLSSLGPSLALAAPACNNKTCEKDPRKGPTCFKATGSNCSVSGGCTSTIC